RRVRMFRTRVAVAAAAAFALGVAAWGAYAQAPAPSEPPASPPPQSQPAPTPAEPTPPAQPPAAQPPAAQPSPQADAFGEEVQVEAKTIIFFKGTATWDSAYDTLIDAFKTVQSFIEKEKLKPSGPSMTIYLSTDDTGFEFRAAIPVAEAPANPPKGDIEM